MEQTSRHIRACYDAVAREYAERFAGELAHKPLDRELLNRFASVVRGRGDVYDLGCGPGQCGGRVLPRFMIPTETSLPPQISPP
jgi:trans-aconitate methyltransferase